MKISGFILVLLLGISLAAFGVDHLSANNSANIMVAANGTPGGAPLNPSPRLLPLQLTVPPTAQVGIPLAGVSITLQNPGDIAPNAMLRLILHGQAPGPISGLSPESVKVEVLEQGVWKPVLLGMVEGGVMGAIGAEGGVSHSQRYGSSGFSIPAGLNKTWQLRLTFSQPGTYSLVTAVSPDNGSTHLAQPAHSTIVVQ